MELREINFVRAIVNNKAISLSEVFQGLKAMRDCGHISQDCLERAMAVRISKNIKGI